MDRDLRAGDLLADRGGCERRALLISRLRAAAEGDGRRSPRSAPCAMRTSGTSRISRASARRPSRTRSSARSSRRRRSRPRRRRALAAAASTSACITVGRLEPEDRQRQQHADQQRDQSRSSSSSRSTIGPVQANFGSRAAFRNAPVRADAAFEEFPGLIDRFDDVVVHADGFGAGDEIAQHRGLLERSGIGVAADCSRRSASRIRRSRCACPGTASRSSSIDGRRPDRPPACR